MKCLVCGYEEADGEASCSRCGFPFIIQIGEDADSESRLMQMADQYRKQACGQYEVGVAVYTNMVRNQQIEVEKTDYIPLGKGNTLMNGMISWYPEAFVRPASNQLEFTYYVKKEDGPRVPRTLKLDLIPAEGDIYIGAMGGDEGTFSFCVGTATDYAQTEKISYFSPLGDED